MSLKVEWTCDGCGMLVWFNNPTHGFRAPDDWSREGAVFAPDAPALDLCKACVTDYREHMNASASAAELAWVAGRQQKAAT